MPRLILVVAACWIVLAAPAAAQLMDAFADGDFTTNPAWTGTTDRWTVAPLDGNPALRSDGMAASDTIYLTTPSAMSRGVWSFTLAHRDVNLSNFNGTRVFLMADTDTLDGAVFGYYLQLGASNSDEVRLYRQDGDPSNRRVLLGQSTEPLLDGDANTLAVSVTRSEAYAWTVSVNGAAVLSTVDSTYTTSRFFGLWLKHTAAAAQAFFFDDIGVEGAIGPGDREPPRLVRAEALDAERVAVTFDEVVDGCFPDRYEISDGIVPARRTGCLHASAGKPAGEWRHVYAHGPKHRRPGGQCAC